LLSERVRPRPPRRTEPTSSRLLLKSCQWFPLGKKCVGSVRRGRPRTDALRQKSVRVSGLMTSVRRAAEDGRAPSEERSGIWSNDFCATGGRGRTRAVRRAFGYLV